MKTANLYLFFLLGLSMSSVAQAPFTYQKLYGDTAKSMVGYDLALASDGNVLFSGICYGASSDAMLMKVTFQGDTLWTKFYDANTFEVFSMIREMADGSIMAGGFIDSLPLIVHLDDQGNWLSAKMIAGAGLNTMRDIIPMPDSGYIGVADAYHITCIFRMDKFGAPVWTSFYNEVNYNDLVMLDDGNLLACGASDDTSSLFDFSDISLLKITTDGNMIWQKVYGDSVHQTAISALQGSDGNYYVTGQQNDPVLDTDVLLMKFDTSGNNLWNKSFSGVAQDVAVRISPLWQDQLLINGQSFSLIPGKSFGFMMRVNEAGTLQWFRAYGDTMSNGSWAVLHTDSSFLLSGLASIYNHSQGIYEFRATLIHTDTSGNSGCFELNGNFNEQAISYLTYSASSQINLSVNFVDTTLSTHSGTNIYTRCPIVGIDEKEEIQSLIYPNPSFGFFNIVERNDLNKPIEIIIYDATGSQVKRIPMSNDQLSFTLRQGVYFYQLRFTNGAISSGKLISLD